MKKTVLLFSVLCCLLISMMGCSGKEGPLPSNETTSESDKGEVEAESSGQNNVVDLMDYLGMDIEQAGNQLRSLGYFSHISFGSSENSDFRSIEFANNRDDYVVHMQSQMGKYVDQATIYQSDVEEQLLSILGIYPGMVASEAIDAINKNGYTFRSISDFTNEEKGDYQMVYFDKNGVYRIGFEIYGGGNQNPYGSLDESDIHTDGTLGAIVCQCVTSDRYEELANGIGGWGSSWGTIIVDELTEYCAELTSFTENKSFDVEGGGTYGTYVFGNGVISIDLQPGAGEWERLTRVSISDICPYKLCGIYYGMDRESALNQMSELEISKHSEEGNKVVYDIDPYTTLEIQFVDDKVSFVECIDDYPGEHEKREIEY